MNTYQVYYESYEQLARKHGKDVKTKVLNSAKLIISKNIVQGNFLTKLSISGKPLVFSEWKVTNLNKETRVLYVQRTEYTLHDIVEGIEKEKGETSPHLGKIEQLDIFHLLDDEETLIAEKRQMKYVLVKITDVYKEEKEEVNG